ASVLTFESTFRKSPRAEDSRRKRHSPSSLTHSKLTLISIEGDGWPVVVTLTRLAAARKVARSPSILILETARLKKLCLKRLKFLCTACRRPSIPSAFRLHSLRKLSTSPRA